MIEGTYVESKNSKPWRKSKMAMKDSNHAPYKINNHRPRHEVGIEISQNTDVLSLLSIVGQHLVEGSPYGYSDFLTELGSMPGIDGDDAAEDGEFGSLVGNHELTYVWR